MVRPVLSAPARFERLEGRDLFSVVPHPSLTPAAAHGRPVLHAAPAAGGVGLSAQYFADAGLTTPSMVRTDAAVSFKGTGGAAAALRSAGGARWTGSIVAPATSTYTFTVQGVGGVKLWVNGVKLVDTAAIPGGAVRATAPVSLTAGTRYSLRMDYAKGAGTVPNVKLLWAANKAKQVVVPQSSLFPAATPPALAATSAGLIGQYFVGTNFKQLAFTRVDPTVNFNFGSSSPDVTIPKHTPFSILWTGQLHPARSENYTFTTTSDDGIRVYVGTQLVIDNFVQQSTHTASGQIALTAGQAYDLKVEYFQNGVGVGDVKLQYSTPSVPLSVVSPSMLSSTPPATAAALSAVAAAAAEVDLSWTGSPTATGYAVSRSTDGGATWQADGATPAGTTTFADTALTADTAYAYRVAPLGSADTSTPSNVATATTLAVAPSAVTATAADPTDVAVNWADVPGATGFTVLAAAAGGPFAAVATLPAGATTAVVGGLFPGTAYQFEVAAANAAGQPSAPSDPAAATTPTLAPAAATAAATSATSAQVSWAAAAAATGYAVERSADGVAWTTVAMPDAATLTLTDAGLSAGTAYSYRVRATDAGGASEASPVAVALTIPAVPAVSVAGVDVNTSTVTVAAVTGAASYTVQRSANGTTGWVTVGTATASAAATVSVPNVAPSTVYYYRAFATNATGSSAPGAAVGQMSAPPARYAVDAQVFGVAAATGGVYAVNMLGGTSTLVGQLLPGAYAANRNPVDGDVYYFVGASATPAVYKWDPTTGNNAVVAASNTYAAQPNRRAYDLAGTVWQTDAAGNLYSVSQATHATALVGQMKVGTVALASAAGNMAFSPNGTLYLANGGQLYTVNTATAALTPALTLGVNNVNITFGNGGLLFATDSNGHEYSVNPTSLVSTLLGNPAVPAFNSLTASPEFADLGVTAAAAPLTFHAGQTAAYSVGVSNAGPAAAAAGTVTVTATLGTGLTFASVAGTGWSAVATTTANGTTVTLTYAGPLAATANAPTATLTVNVTSAAHVSAATTFAVAGQQFDTTAANNTAAVTSAVA